MSAGFRVFQVDVLQAPARFQQPASLMVEAKAALVEMVSALYYERRRETARQASDRDLREAAELHRRIYQAIRAHDAEAARNAMNEHLIRASAHQALEASEAQRPKRGRQTGRRQPPG